MDARSVTGYEKWKTAGESFKFSYHVSPVDDTYQWGAHTVPRKGLLLKLSHDETGEIKEFYLAGASQTAPIESHMSSMTDDLLLSWFVKREKKPKVKKIKCTAPCFPVCTNSASTELLSLTNAHLGFNCDQHIAPLRFEKMGKLEAEYTKRPLQNDKQVKDPQNKTVQDSK